MRQERLGRDLAGLARPASVPSLGEPRALAGQHHRRPVLADHVEEPEQQVLTRQGPIGQQPAPERSAAEMTGPLAPASSVRSRSKIARSVAMAAP